MPKGATLSQPLSPAGSSEGNSKNPLEQKVAPALLPAQLPSLCQAPTSSRPPTSGDWRLLLKPPWGGGGGAAGRWATRAEAKQVRTLGSVLVASRDNLQLGVLRG